MQALCYFGYCLLSAFYSCWAHKRGWSVFVYLAVWLRGTWVQSTQIFAFYCVHATYKDVTQCLPLTAYFLYQILPICIGTLKNQISTLPSNLLSLDSMGEPMVTFIYLKIINFNQFHCTLLNEYINSCSKQSKYICVI